MGQVLQSILQQILGGGGGVTGFGTNPPANVGAQPTPSLGTPNPTGQGYFPTAATFGGASGILGPGLESILNTPPLTQAGQANGNVNLQQIIQQLTGGGGQPQNVASASGSAQPQPSAGWQFQSATGGGPLSASGWVWGGTGLPQTDPYGNPYTLPSGVQPNNGIASYSVGGQNYWVPGFGTAGATGGTTSGGQQAGGAAGFGGGGGWGGQGIGGANNPEQGGNPGGGVTV